MVYYSMLKYPPSMIAAAATFLSLRVTGRQGWVRAYYDTLDVISRMLHYSIIQDILNQKLCHALMNWYA